MKHDAGEDRLVGKVLALQAEGSEPDPQTHAKEQDMWSWQVGSVVKSML